jgi:hypothetical protein
MGSVNVMDYKGIIKSTEDNNKKVAETFSSL